MQPCDVVTFGKCVWNGCTRHAVKASTGACRTHHTRVREARCMKCAGALRTTQELDNRICRQCSAERAA